MSTSLATSVARPTPSQSKRNLVSLLTPVVIVKVWDRRRRGEVGIFLEVEQ